MKIKTENKIKRINKKNYFYSWRDDVYFFTDYSARYAL